MTTLNIHPLVVHFPIALLTVYTALEIFRLPVLTRQSWWHPTKTILLLIGTIGGLLALQTGDMAEDAYRGSPLRSLIELHSTFANASIIVYGILTASHVIAWVRMAGAEKAIPSYLQGIWSVLDGLEKVIFSTPVLMLGALAGLVLITITGALGGAIVYGPDVDPIVSYIYHLFFQS